MIPVSACRTPIACSNCAKTKTKCDQQVPCSRCAGRGINCTPLVKGRAIQNATSMYEVMTPEKLAFSDSHSALAAIAENRRIQAPAQTTNQKSGQVRSMLELGNSNNGLEGIPGYKETGLFVDESTPQSYQSFASGPTTLSPSTMLSCLPGEQKTFSQNPLMSDLDEPDHTSTLQSSLSLPHIMLEWTQVHLPLRSDETDRLVQPMLFDPSVSCPYQDFDGTMPVMANVRHTHPSRDPLVVTHAPTSGHPHIARRITARNNARNLRKWHGS
jgi:hypothetical protein